MPEWGMTGPEFAALVALGHTRVAHVDAQLCTEPDCVSVRLLADHPDDWAKLTVDDFRTWLAGPAGKP